MVARESHIRCYRWASLLLAVLCLPWLSFCSRPVHHAGLRVVRTKAPRRSRDMLSRERQERNETPVRSGDDVNGWCERSLGSTALRLDGARLLSRCGAVVAGLSRFRAVEHPLGIDRAATAPVYLLQLSFLI
jgi:hypothetical protein